MAVYVDNMLRRATVGRTTSDWSHLLADTSEELHQMARALGLGPEWCQYAGTHREHYDLTRPKRNKALELGATPISYPRETGGFVARKKKGAST